MDTKLRAKGVLYDPEEEALRLAVQDSGGAGGPRRRDEGRRPCEGARDQGFDAQAVSAGPRGDGRERLPRKRQPEGRQGLRDREAPQKDRGTRARERAAKKLPGLLESRPCMRREFLKEHRGEFGPIRKACGILRVSKSECCHSLPRSCDRRVPKEGYGFWSMLGHMAEKLVTDALEQVVGGENPPDDFSPFHDGQGSRHTSRTFQCCFESHGIARFMSRSGNPMGGDALAESLFKMLKCEPVTARTTRRRRGEAGHVQVHRAQLQQAENALIDRL